jgi:hypothetical protein
MDFHAFYRHEAPDDRGRMLATILQWDDDKLERSHNTIQRLFPMVEQSRAQPGAPLLSREQIVRIQNDPQAVEGVRQAFDRMMLFYGFERRTAQSLGSQITSLHRLPDWEERSRVWLTPNNHNFLRLTRILKSLRLLELHALSEILYQVLQSVYNEKRVVIGERTFQFWTDAAMSSLNENQS